MRVDMKNISILVVLMFSSLGRFYQYQDLCMDYEMYIYYRVLARTQATSYEALK